MLVADFAEAVHAQLESALAPTQLVFVGSFGTDTFDEFSDVDLEVEVRDPLDRAFYATLESGLRNRFGQALVRFDPDYAEDLSAQDVRFSFYELPVFWRVDLLVRSQAVTDKKWPSPFPEWALGTSVLMRAIWAIKWRRRGHPERADTYLTSSFEKLRRPQPPGVDPLIYLLEALQERDDVDRLLLERTMKLDVASTA